MAHYQVTVDRDLLQGYPRPAALVESARTCAGEKVANLFDSNIILWNR